MGWVAPSPFTSAIAQKSHMDTDQRPLPHTLTSITEDLRAIGCWTSARWDGFDNREIRLARAVP